MAQRPSELVGLVSKLRQSFVHCVQTLFKLLSLGGKSFGFISCRGLSRGR